MIQANDPTKVAQAQERLRHLAVENTPEVRNLQAVNSLSIIDVMEFQGRVFLIPPLPHKLGVAMLKLSFDAKRVSQVPDLEARLVQQEQLCDEAALLFNKAVVPVGWKGLVFRVPLVGRWFIRNVLGNPFNDCSIFEVQQLLLFFSTCRTTSSVRLAPSAAANLARSS